MKFDRARRLLVTMVLGAGSLFLSTAPAFANHYPYDWDDDNHFCAVDSDVADVEEGPVGVDTPNYGWCSYASGGIPAVEGPDVAGGTRATSDAGTGDVGADAAGIVPAVRIDAGAGAMASTSAAGPAVGAIMGASALLATALEGLRRHRRR